MKHLDIRTTIYKNYSTHLNPTRLLKKLFIFYQYQIIKIANTYQNERRYEYEDYQYRMIVIIADHYFVLMSNLGIFKIDQV